MKIDLNNVVFQQKVLATNHLEVYNTYCRIMIVVEKGNSGDFAKSIDYEDLDAYNLYFPKLRFTKYWWIYAWSL